MCAALPIISMFRPSAYDQVFDAPIIHLGGTGLLARLDGEPSRVLLQGGQASRTPVTFDLIAASAETIGIVKPLLPFIDYFMPSIEEARDMSGQDGAGRLRAILLDHGAPAASSHWAAKALSTRIATARGSRARPMISRSSIPLAAAMLSMPAS